MSARIVWSGTRPSRYHSLRAISPPPSRPAHAIRMPSAPRRSAEVTAFFMARRNATRFWSGSSTFASRRVGSRSDASSGPSLCLLLGLGPFGLGPLGFGTLGLRGAFPGRLGRRAGRAAPLAGGRCARRRRLGWPRRRRGALARRRGGPRGAVGLVAHPDRQVAG